MNPDWIEHRRGLDGERLGWMKPVGEGFVVVDLLGRERTEVLEWLEAEEALDDLGIGYLADAYELRLESGAWLRVRILEVSTDCIRLKTEDWGDMTSGAPIEQHHIEFPAGDELRLFTR